MQIPSRMVLSEKCREEGKPLKRFTSRHRWLTPGLRDCVEMRFAAVPPDVRKGCALPARVNGIRGYAPTQGRSPGMIRVLPPVGRSRHRTSGGTAANRSFYTVLDNDRMPHHRVPVRGSRIQNQERTGVPRRATRLGWWQRPDSWSTKRSVMSRSSALRRTK